MHQFKAGFENVDKAVKQGEKLRELAASTAKTGLVMGGVGAAIALPFKGAIEATDELEDHMNRLMVASGKMNDAMARSQAMKFVQDQSIATGYSANDLTESLYQGVSGFLTFDQAMAASTVSAKLARVTRGDLASTTGLLTTMILNFGDATKTPLQNAQILSDELAALQTQFKFTDLGDLTAAMRIAGPAMLGFGIQRQQGEAVLAALSAGGDIGETGGEALREILAQSMKVSRKLGFEVFAGPNGKGIDLLKTLDGIKARFGDISQNKDVSAMFEQAFGRQAFSALSIVLKNLDKAHQAVTGLANSAGTVDKGFEVFNESGSMVFDRLHQSMTAIENHNGRHAAAARREIRTFVGRQSCTGADELHAKPSAAREDRRDDGGDYGFDAAAGRRARARVFGLDGLRQFRARREGICQGDAIGRGRDETVGGRAMAIKRGDGCEPDWTSHHRRGGARGRRLRGL